MMKRIIGFAAVMVLLVGLTVTPVLAADVTAVVDFNSVYIWRGLTFNNGMVAQPSIDVTKGGFGFNVWGNYDIDDYDESLDDGEFSEIDLTLSYGWTISEFDVALGYIEYIFPTTDAGGAPGTREIYLSLGTDLPASFSLALDIYYDFDELDDYYSLLSLSYAHDINDKTSLVVGVAAAYAGDEYSADGDSGFYDYTVSLSISHAINDAWSIGASTNHVDALDDTKLKDGDEAGTLDVNTYGGISISYSF